MAVVLRVPAGWCLTPPAAARCPREVFTPQEATIRRSLSQSASNLSLSGAARGWGGGGGSAAAAVAAASRRSSASSTAPVVHTGGLGDGETESPFTSPTYGTRSIGDDWPTPSGLPSADYGPSPSTGNVGVTPAANSFRALELSTPPVGGGPAFGSPFGAAAGGSGGSYFAATSATSGFSPGSGVPNPSPPREGRGAPPGPPAEGRTPPDAAAMSTPSPNSISSGSAGTKSAGTTPAGAPPARARAGSGAKASGAPAAKATAAGGGAAGGGGAGRKASAARSPAATVAAAVAAAAAGAAAPTPPGPGGAYMAELPSPGGSGSGGGSDFDAGGAVASTASVANTPYRFMSTDGAYEGSDTGAFYPRDDDLGRPWTPLPDVFFDGSGGGGGSSGGGGGGSGGSGGGGGGGGSGGPGSAGGSSASAEGMHFAGRAPSPPPPLRSGASPYDASDDRTPRDTMPL